MSLRICAVGCLDCPPFACLFVYLFVVCVFVVCLFLFFFCLRARLYVCVVVVNAFVCSFVWLVSGLFVRLCLCVHVFVCSFVWSCVC